MSQPQQLLNGYEQHSNWQLDRPFDLTITADSYGSFIAFVAIHLACLAAFWTGVDTTAVCLLVACFSLRMFGITAGYHRYFSHRSFKTGRVFQFILAFLGQASLQRGVIWWAAKHREHHRDSDQPADAHSPVQHGFWFSHLGWIFNNDAYQADYSKVSDLTRYPELVWLDGNKYLPGLLMGLACIAIGGWSGLVIGFFCSTVLLWHAVFSINSLAHVVGKQRYLTGDESRNNWFLALITFGEGWHNNHHYYMASARQGFFWWEIDLSYYLLRVLSALGLVWDIKRPTERVIQGQRVASETILERISERLAERFPLENMLLSVQEKLAELSAKPANENAQVRVDHPEQKTAEQWRELVLREIPSTEEIQLIAQKIYAATESLQIAVERAQEKLRVRLEQLVAEQQPIPQA